MVLGKRANAFAAACRHVLTPAKVASFAKPPPEVKTDAGDPEDEAEAEQIAEVMRALKEAVGKTLKPADFAKQTETAAKRVVKHSQSEFDRLGINLLDGEPDLSDMIDGWRSACVDRITSVEEDQLAKIEKILKDGANHRVETLATEIEWQIEDVTTSRAELIARDQTLKLNALVTKERHAAAGIQTYIWTTSSDERVRETHAALEGQEFSWEDPPEINDDGDTGCPGEDYQCRCIAFPVLPELDDEEPAPEADDEEPTPTDGEE